MRPQAHVASSLFVWSCGAGPVREAPAHALAGNLPDFDRNVAKALGVERRDHHRWVSHSFVGWAPPSAAALILARDSPHRALVARLVGCVWLHLLLDSYADGVAWLWPLRGDKIGLFRKPEAIRDRGWHTPAPLSTNMGRAEAAMWVGTAVALLLRRK